MPDNFSLDDEALTQYARQQTVLYPEKFGYMGQYSRELLECSTSEDLLATYGVGNILLRLTTSILCGQTISEKPQVEMNMPESPWQHFKHTTAQKIDRLDDRWQGHDPDTWEQTTPPPWTVLLWPLLVLFPRWIKKYPVKWAKITADIEFEQHVLYPEVDHVPADIGRAVIYETLSVNYPHTQPPFGSRLSHDPSRFLNRHEIAHDILRDPDSARYGVTADPSFVLYWLERHGVNVDQLVKRR